MITTVQHGDLSSILLQFMKTPIIALLILLGTTHLQAQSSELDPSHQLWWANLGVGVGNGGFLFAGSLNKPVNRSLLLTLRGTQNAEFCIFCSYTEELWDVSLIAGYYKKGKTGFSSIGTGLGINGRSVNGTGGPDNFVTVGIPVESQFFLTSRSAGIGIVALANLNLKRSFYGAVLSVQFGNLR